MDNHDPLTNEAEDAEARAVEGGAMTLTPEDLKQVRNGVISALTHNGDVTAYLDARARAALDTAFHEDTGSEIIRKQIKNATFEAVKEAVRLGIVAPGPHPGGD